MAPNFLDDLASDDDQFERDSLRSCLPVISFVAASLVATNTVDWLDCDSRVFVKSPLDVREKYHSGVIYELPSLGPIYVPRHLNELVTN
ncbi:hypothetical protein NL676_008362 [Syzygium grande]|nr:hypothetical protein NL676_008362 [Syzygium grande]